MVFMQRYASPLGGLLLAADEQGLIGLKAFRSESAGGARGKAHADS